MGFINILYLFGLFLVIIPLLLHLLRKRMEVVIEFPAVKYLMRAQQKMKRNIVFSDMFLMLLRCLIIVFLSLSMSRPYLGEPSVMKEKNANTALLIDTSMSMCAGDFMKNAKAMAESIFRGFNSKILVGRFSDSPDEIVRSEDEGKRIIRNLSCTYKSTDIYEALKGVSTVLGEGEKNVYLITDFTANGWNINRILSFLEEENIHLFLLDASQNRGVENYFIKNFEYEVTQESKRIKVILESNTENKNKHRVSLNIAGHSKLNTFVIPGEEAVFNITKQTSGEGFVEVEDADLPEDNRYYFYIEPDITSEILIVEGEPDPRPFRSASYFLLKALSTLREKIKFNYTVVPSSVLETMDDFPYDIIFLLHINSSQKETLEKIWARVEKGAGLVFVPGSNTDIGWLRVNFLEKTGVEPKVVQEGKFTIMMPAEVSMKGKLTGSPVFKKRLLLKPLESEHIRTMLTFSDGVPGICISDFGEGRIVFMSAGLNPDWTNLPLSGFFVPLIYEILNELLYSKKTFEIKRLTTGKYNFEFAKTTNPELIAPDGQVIPVIKEENYIQADLNFPGIYRFDRHLLVVNTDYKESELQKLNIKELEGRSDKIKLLQGKSTGTATKYFLPLWQYFIIILGIILALEAIVSGLRK